MSELVIRQTTDIDAPAAVVWRVLTENTFISQYMFGCRAETDWRPGSPLLWRGAADKHVYVKGAVVAFDAPKGGQPGRLAYTVIDPNAPIADVPENYLTMTCEIRPRGANACTLEIRQGNFATVANGRQRYEDSLNGDDSILTAIRRLAEGEAARLAALG